MKTVFNPGLYALTPQRYPDASRLVREVRAALEGGAAMVQFRDKSGDGEWRKAVAGELRADCEAFGVPLIINDDVGLAAEIGAAGVHLGKGDPPVKAARHALGPDALTGVSCYDSLDRARAAVDQGADYLAFGSIFPSGTKPGAVRCPLSTVTAAREFGLPVVAIGGLTPDNGRAAIEAGAAGLAVISAVFDACDVRRAAGMFSQLWSGSPEP